MKKQRYYSVLLLGCLLALVSCQKAAISYVPCQIEEGEGWSFMDAKGHIVLENEFEYCPSYVYNNLFYVWGGDSYTLYRFDKRHPKKLIDNLSQVGLMEDGLMPICIVDEGIQVIDDKGKTVFYLDKLHGNKVAYCDNVFNQGYLMVVAVDDNQNEVMNLVDKTGKPLFATDYALIQMVTPDLFYVTEVDDPALCSYMINARGEVQTQWKQGLTISYSTNRYVAMYDVDNQTYVFDLQGQELCRCSLKNDDVYMICNFVEDNFVFMNSQFEYGLMNLQGETIIPAKYNELLPLENTYLVRTSYEGPYTQLDNRGRRIDTEDDYSLITDIEGFGLMGCKDDRYYLLDEDLDELNPRGFLRLDWNVHCYISASDNNILN